LDTTKLDAAYRRLLAVAESIPDTTGYPAAARADIDWTLSHIALSDPILTVAARDIINEHTAVIDNQHAIDESAIADLIASISHEQRVAMVRAHAYELVEALGEVPDQVAARPVLLRLFNREGESLPEQRMPWRDLIELRATRHIPGHAARIESYESAGKDGTGGSSD
jgi:hypothetical protein